MEIARATHWLKARRWWVALLVVIIGGYSFGKDMALRDNARDAGASAERVGDA